MENSYWKTDKLLRVIWRMFFMTHLMYNEIQKQYFYFFGWSYFFSFGFFGWKKVNIWFLNEYIDGNVKSAYIR